MSLAYVAEKYTRGRDLMARSHGSLQDRLRRAFVHHIASVVGERDLPDGLREEHDALLARATRVVDGEGDSSLAATFGQMSDQEASEVAEEVLYLEYRIRSLHQAPPWHFVGQPTALIRVMPEPIDPEPMVRGPEVN
jgi:hypothetical protein